LKKWFPTEKNRRRVMMLVKAATQWTNSSKHLIPLLEPGDIIH